MRGGRPRRYVHVAPFPTTQRLWHHERSFVCVTVPHGHHQDKARRKNMRTASSATCVLVSSRAPRGSWPTISGSLCEVDSGVCCYASAGATVPRVLVLSGLPCLHRASCQSIEAGTLLLGTSYEVVCISLCRVPKTMHLAACPLEGGRGVTGSSGGLASHPSGGWAPLPAPAPACRARPPSFHTVCTSVRAASRLQGPRYTAAREEARSQTDLTCASDPPLRDPSATPPLDSTPHSWGTRHTPTHRPAQALGQGRPRGHVPLGCQGPVG